MSSWGLFLRPFLQARCACWSLAPAASSRPSRFAPRSGFNILSSKRGNKQYYKGKGGPSLGRHTKLGA